VLDPNCNNKLNLIVASYRDRKNLKARLDEIWDDEPNESPESPAN